MKIQLDYDNKTITLEDNVNLGEFVDKVKKILPDFKEWKLNTQTVIDWVNPITVPYIPYVPYRAYPWWEWAGTGTYKILEDCDTFTGKAPTITTGAYCLEIN